VISLARGPGSISVPTSKSQQVVDWITGEIAAGRFRPGEPIPSARALREQFDVSTTVVREAVLRLKAAGVLEGLPGVAVYVVDPQP
jgi:GntR family transcriptional regulator